METQGFSWLQRVLPWCVRELSFSSPGCLVKGTKFCKMPLGLFNWQQLTQGKINSYFVLFPLSLEHQAAGTLTSKTHRAWCCVASGSSRSFHSNPWTDSLWDGFLCFLPFWCAVSVDKLRNTKLKKLQKFTRLVSRWSSQDSNPVCLVAKPMILLRL